MLGVYKETSPWKHLESFYHKMGYIHFCQFEIFAIEAAEI